MKRSTVVVVVALVLGAAAGCQDDEHFPPGEGGGPSGGGGSNQNDAGGGGSIDAGTGDAGTGDAGATLAGELCDVSDDVRAPLACPDVNLSDIEVRAVGSGANDETDADGDFTLSGDVEDADLLSIGTVDGDTRLSLAPVADWDLASLRVPRVDTADWNQLIATIGTNEPDGSASIALYVVNVENGLPAAGVAVSTVSDTVIFYDAGAADEWEPLGGTGLFGAALILSVPADVDSVQVTVNDVDFPIPVRPDHLTWARLRV
jgi:hypothetical protein